MIEGFSCAEALSEILPDCARGRFYTVRPGFPAEEPGGGPGDRQRRFDGVTKTSTPRPTRLRSIHSRAEAAPVALNECAIVR